jgi:thioredoxin-dependent peroxiredoxin
LNHFRNWVEKKFLQPYLPWKFQQRFAFAGCCFLLSARVLTKKVACLVFVILITDSCLEGAIYMTKLNKGDKAPDFRLSDQNEQENKLEDFKGKKLLVYFYPKADTPGCTKQACNVRDAREDLADLGVNVVGISPDTPAIQKKFDDKHGLGFSLLSDQDNTIAKTYGAWGEKSMYGKKYEGIIRSSMLIDEQGKVIETWYKVSPKDTVAKALKTLEED